MKRLGLIITSILFTGRLAYAYDAAPILLPTGNLTCEATETLVVTPVGPNEISVKCLKGTMLKTGGPKCEEPELCYKTDIDLPVTQEI